MTQLTTGSNTQTLQEQSQPVLHLRANIEETLEQTDEEQSHGVSLRPRVRWTNDVVDNEHMDKKKSKICCIFHPQREFGESSDESLSSSSDSSDESGAEGERGDAVRNGQPVKKDAKKKKHDQCCGKNKHKSSPNAYERQPNYKNQSILPENAI